MTNSPAEEYAEIENFPAWTYALIPSKAVARVVSIIHVETQNEPVVHWCDDPERPQHTMPLFKSMSARPLGDYESILAGEGCLEIFSALCREMHDLPDPLLAVQVIHWLGMREVFADEGDRRPAVMLALHSLQAERSMRRRQYEAMVRHQAGLGPIAQATS